MLSVVQNFPAKRNYNFERNFPVRKTGEAKLKKRYEAQNLDLFLFAAELIFKYFGLIS